MNRRVIKQYTFTVEGETEKWYLDWLQDCINEAPESLYTVNISSQVNKDPLKFAKTVNPIATPSAVHICDYESNDDMHVQQFRQILEKLKKSNSLIGRSFRYSLGYSNFTFELWIVLHKADCYGCFASRTQYLKPINKAYNTDFENLRQYKEKDQFKRCLAKLSLDDVKKAIARSKKIMELNTQNEAPYQSYKGFSYYQNNPALTIWESIEKILLDCGLI